MLPGVTVSISGFSTCSAISRGGQPVQKQQSQPLPTDRDLPGIEIRCIPKARLHVLHAPMRHGFASCLDDSSVIFPQIAEKYTCFPLSQVCISRLFVVDYSESDLKSHIFNMYLEMYRHV